MLIGNEDDVDLQNDLLDRTTIDEVRGCLKYTGPRVTLEQMDKAVLAEARKRR